MSGVLIKGALDSLQRAIFEWSTNDGVWTSGNKPTVGLCMYRATPRNVAAIAGDTVVTLAGSDNGTTTVDHSVSEQDFRLRSAVGTAGATNVQLVIRTTIHNDYKSAGIPLVEDQEFVCFALLNFTTNSLKFFTDGGQLGTEVALNAGDSFRSSQFRPFFRGRLADSKDIEWHEIAYWHNANDLTVTDGVSAFVPTEAQILAYTMGQSLASWPAPKSHMVPDGSNGATATTIPDLAHAERSFSQTIATVSGAYLPTFVSTEVPDVAPGAIEVSSQSAEFAYSLGVTGTAHLMIGLASANAGDPTTTQIVNGQNQNGTAATAKEAFVHATTGVKESRLTGTAAAVAYKAFLTVETAPGVFTPVVSWTFTTPRIGVRSSANYINEAAPALWANETAVSVSVAADGFPAFVGTGETGADGRVVADLSGEEGFHLPVGASVKMAFEKGIYHGSETVSIVNLEA